MHFYGDPHQLTRLATRLSATADEVRVHAARMSQQAYSLDWESNAADRFRHEVDSLARTLSWKAGDLSAAAAALEAHAARVQAMMAEIAAVESGVHRFLETAGDTALGLPVVLNPLRLPESGSKEWLEISDMLRRAGVHL
jgi:uncharacterized protein (DUF3084 family)